MGGCGDHVENVVALEGSGGRVDNFQNLDKESRLEVTKTLEKLKIVPFTETSIFSYVGNMHFNGINKIEITQTQMPDFILSFRLACTSTRA